MEIRFDTDEIQRVVDRFMAEAFGDHLDLTRPLAVSEAQAAELLGLAPHQLRDIRRRGMIHPVKAGRGYRYSKKTLLDFLQSGEPK